MKFGEEPEKAPGETAIDVTLIVVNLGQGAYQLSMIAGKRIRTVRGSLDDIAEAIEDSTSKQSRTRIDEARAAKNVVAPVTERAALTLIREAGWNARDFDRKVRALQDLAERGKLRKASGTAALRQGATGQYKNRLIRQVYDTIGATDPEKAERLAARIRSMHADHIQDLQLSGLDDASNLWLLDADVNVGLGRQIWEQIKDFPDGTRIDRIIVSGQ